MRRERERRRGGEGERGEGEERQRAQESERESEAKTERTTSQREQTSMMLVEGKRLTEKGREIVSGAHSFAGAAHQRIQVQQISPESLPL